MLFPERFLCLESRDPWSCRPGTQAHARAHTPIRTHTQADLCLSLCCDRLFILCACRTEEEKKDWIQVGRLLINSSLISVKSEKIKVTRYVCIRAFVCVQAIQATIQRHEQTVESFRHLTFSLRDDESTPPHSPVRLEGVSPARPLLSPLSPHTHLFLSSELCGVGETGANTHSREGSDPVHEVPGAI